MKKSIFCLLFVFFMLSNICDISLNSAFSANLSNEISDQNLLSVSAKSALLIDYDSNTIIYEKNISERLPIASMTKLATLAIVFQAVDNGVVKLSDDVVISKNAAAVGGSSAFLDAGSKYKLSDLIKTIVVSSANDSSVAVAEFLCGSESLFVEKMNK